MRHRRKTTKLQRNSAQRRALLSNLTCSLIEHGRIETTVADSSSFASTGNMSTFSLTSGIWFQ